MTEKATRRPAVFLDRDGTLVEEVNFLSRLEDLRVFPYTREALEIFRSKGYHVIVITNQSGIGRRIFGESAMHAIHDQINTELPGLIDAYYFCPRLPDDGCRCRKPRLGMIEDASEEFPIDLERSWLIGDKKIDVETGFNAGVQTALVLTGYGASHRDLLEKEPDIIAEHLLDAARRITDY